MIWCYDGCFGWFLPPSPGIQSAEKQLSSHGIVQNSRSKQKNWHGYLVVRVKYPMRIIFIIWVCYVWGSQSSMDSSFAGVTSFTIPIAASGFFVCFVNSFTSSELPSSLVDSTVSRVTTQVLINGSFVCHISHIILCCLIKFGVTCFLGNFRVFFFIYFYPTLCSYLFDCLLLPQILAGVASSLHHIQQQQTPFEYLFLELEMCTHGLLSVNRNSNSSTSGVIPIVGSQFLLHLRPSLPFR